MVHGFCMEIIRGNRKDLREFIEFAIANGIKHVALTVLRNMGRAQGNSELVYDYKNNIQELMKINKEMAELRHEYKDSVDIVSNMFENQSGCPFNRPQDFYLSPRIDCYGNLYICESFDGKDNIVGNVFKQSLEGIFESKRFEEYVTLLFERQIKNDGCKKCLLNQKCTGGCPADQYMEAGNFLSCTSQCSIIKENFKNALFAGGIL